eukprot:382544_1
MDDEKYASNEKWALSDNILFNNNKRLHAKGTITDLKLDVVIDEKDPDDESEETNNIRNESNNEMVAMSNDLDYALNTLNDPEINKKKDKIKEYFQENSVCGETFKKMAPEKLGNAVVSYCNNKKIKKSFLELHEIIQFKQLHLMLKQQKQEKSYCDCCFSEFELTPVKITSREKLANKLVLEWEYIENKYMYDNSIQNKNATQMQQSIELGIKTNLNDKLLLHKQLSRPILMEQSKLQISAKTYKIQCVNAKYADFAKGDILCKIGICDNKQEAVTQDYDLNEFSASDVYKLIKHEPLPFTLTFKTKDCKLMSLNKKVANKCIQCCKKQTTKKSNKKSKYKQCASCLKTCCKTNNPQNQGCIGILIQWLIKIVTLSIGVTSKVTSMLDAATDMILLYKASANDDPAIIFTIITVITLLSPYILSYSAGVQIFLYRKTFQNVELFTFHSLLLGLYLFPSGIIYFILLDIIDVLMEIYKLFAYGCINKIKSQQELVQVESVVAEYFGMSRMDFFSFKKQKLISQIFFETLPQIILQVLLFSSIVKG